MLEVVEESLLVGELVRSAGGFLRIHRLHRPGDAGKARLLREDWIERDCEPERIEIEFGVAEIRWPARDRGIEVVRYSGKSNDGVESASRGSSGDLRGCPKAARASPRLS